MVARLEGFTTVAELDELILETRTRLREIEAQATLETGSAQEGARIAQQYGDLFCLPILELQRHAAACQGGRISKEAASQIFEAEMRKKGLVPISQILRRK